MIFTPQQMRLFFFGNLFATNILLFLILVELKNILLYQQYIRQQSSNKQLNNPP